jgi:hypothetical protein
MSNEFDPYHVWLGIPPEEQPPNHYRLLGLRPLEANADVISNALDQRRAFLRSVQAGKRAAQSQQLLNEVSAAGVTLLDPAKKAPYDAELRKKLSPRPAPAARAAAGLPDPMAPLAIGDLLPPQRAAAGPSNRGASPVAALLPARPAPVVLSAPVFSKRSKRAPSSSMVTAVVLSCAALTLATIFLGVWWVMNKGTSTATASGGAAPAQPSASLPPGLPPVLPADPQQAAASIQSNGEGPSSSGVTKKNESVAVATNVPRTSGATPPPQVGNPPSDVSSPQPQSAAPAGSSSAAKPPSPGGRQPVPDSQALSQAEEAARKLYANELKAATKGPQLIALGNAILSAGRATQNDLVDRFALIDLSRTLFIQAGDAAEALTAARLLEIEFDIPREQLLTTTIEALDNGSIIPEHRLMVTRTAADLADSAADAQEFERAEKLATIALQSGAKLRDADLRKQLTDRRNHIQRLVNEWNTVKPSLEKLKSEPEDTMANLVAGKFYCFSVEDFYRGLPYLAASGEGALAEAAKLDLVAQKADATKKYEAAQAWKKAELKIVERDDKLAAQRRERWLLQQAAGSLAGIEQMEANKRLGQLQNVGPPAGGRKTGDVPAPTMPAKKKKK